MMFIFCILLGYTCPETIKSLRRKDLGVLLNKSAAFCCKTYREHLNSLSEKSIAEILRKELAINSVKKAMFS